MSFCNRQCPALLAGIVILFWPLSLTAQEPQGIPISELGKKYQLLGQTGQPIGKLVKLQGRVSFDAPTKSYNGQPVLIVQRVNGKATQKFLFLPLRAYFGEFGAARGSLPKLENRATYEFEGYETGGYTGIPTEAYNLGGVMMATRGFGFEEQFVAVRGRKTAAVAFSPADFVDRQALLAGEAVNKQGRAYLMGDGWELLIDDRTSWLDWMEHKTAEAFGVVRRTDARAVFRSEQCHSRLVKLEDQVGRQVELRGKPRSINDCWWFVYRGRNIYVENLQNLPGAKQYAPTAIHGILERARLPDPLMTRADQISPTGKPPLQDTFIVRRAVAKPIAELLAPEVLWFRDDD